MINAQRVRELVNSYNDKTIDQKMLIVLEYIEKDILGATSLGLEAIDISRIDVEPSWLYLLFTGGGRDFAITELGKKLVQKLKDEGFKVTVWKKTTDPYIHVGW